MTATARTGLPRDEITHRVLALCAETDAITRRRDKYSVGPTPYLRGKRLCGRDSVLRFAFTLTALEKAGLIAWYDGRNATGTQYAEETPAGKATLLRWDAELLGGAS